MNSENFYDAFENISDELVLGAFDEPKKNFHSVKKLKWTVLAAIIALFVSVPVLAEVFNVNFFYNEVADSYDFVTNARIKETELSEELRSAAAEGQRSFFFKYMDDAEEFIGIDFPDNRYLIAKAGTIYTDPEGNESVSSYHVIVNTNEKNEIINVMCSFFSIGYDHVMYEFITDKSKHDGGAFIYKDSEKQHSGEPEIYTTAAGYECIITNVFGNNIVEARGYLTIDRAFVVVSSIGNNVFEARENLIRKLEAFE